MNTIHDNIRRLRKENNLTQEDVANKIFVTRQLISKWEQGKSLPNINDVEHLAEIFNVSINALIDDESVKSITLSEANDNRKKRKFVWISIVVSILAVLIGIYAIITNILDNEEQVSIFVGYFYVTELDKDNGLITFENDGFVINYDEQQGSISISTTLDEEWLIEDLTVGDNVKISYNTEAPQFLSVLVIDNYLETELYGVIIDATGEDYNEIEDFTSIDAYSDLRFVYKIEDSMAWNTEIEYTFQYDKEYQEYICDVYVDFDPHKTPDTTRIGLITSNGIEYVDIVDVLSQSVYEYTGAYRSQEDTITWTNTTHITYRIHTRFSESINDMTIYEYDKNNDLIMETVISLDSLSSYSPQEETIYAYIETSETSSSPFGSIDIINVSVLYLGDEIELKCAGENGFVRTENFKL